MSETLSFATNRVCRETGGWQDGKYLLSLLHGNIGEHWLELGAGCGEITLLAAVHNPGVRIDALEIQNELAKIAQTNVMSNGLADRIRVFTGDVRHPPHSLPVGGYDKVFCNPPFFIPQAGRMPKKKVRAIARFERHGTLADFVACGARLLRASGQFHLVHRPERLTDILVGFSSQGLKLFRLMPIHSKKKPVARLILASARKEEKS